MSKYQPKIIITSGEPAGIGPDLVIKLSQIKHQYDITVIADADLLIQRAQTLSLPIDFTVVKREGMQRSASPKTLKILDVKLMKACTAGAPDPDNAVYVLNMLDMACKACLAKDYDAIVTMPVQKSVINQAGYSFTGHTEYLARLCKDVSPVMMLSASSLNIALVTTHLPLRQVAESITQERLERTLRIIHHDMVHKFGIEQPRISVCGLNPHAGEGGYLGDEEQLVIQPAIQSSKKKGYLVSGPYPADTVFTQARIDCTDVFVCMYHDQGLPVLKTLAFGKAVNVTLGLPIIRTSVDHGTAMELAGTGNIETGSLLAAINMASVLAQNQQLSNTQVS